MNNFIEISGRKIGYDYEPLVIAEIGINHDGNLDIAVSMVDAAIEAGVEVIKHQTHIADEEMSFEAIVSTLPELARRICIISLSTVVFPDPLEPTRQ